MAKRLATEYVKTCLVLTEAEMLKFVQIFADHQVQLQVKVRKMEVKMLFFRMRRKRRLCFRLSEGM